MLNDYEPERAAPPPPARKARPRQYHAEVKEALIFIWEAAHRICSKRLAPFLPKMVKRLEQHGHLAP